jgi:hypothetical protein
LRAPPEAASPGSPGCRHDRRRRGGRRGPRLVELNLREPTIPASSAYVH